MTDESKSPLPGSDPLRDTWPTRPKHTSPPDADSNTQKEKEVRAVIIATPSPSEENRPSVNAGTPWTLQQFFNGEIDLDAELARRFPNTPLMSVVSFRSNPAARQKRGVATLSTQDNAATVTVDADAETRIVQFSFSYGSMLTLRFRLDELSDMDRTRWLELMRRDSGGLAFLWGQARWEKDYMVCVSRKYFTNIYAFSPANFEAAARLTPDVARQLLNWLENYWKQPPPSDEPPKLLTTW